MTVFQHPAIIELLSRGLFNVLANNHGRRSLSCIWSSLALFWREAFELFDLSSLPPKTLGSVVPVMFWKSTARSQTVQRFLPLDFQAPKG